MSASDPKRTFKTVALCMHAPTNRMHYPHRCPSAAGLTRPMFQHLLQGSIEHDIGLGGHDRRFDGDVGHDAARHGIRVGLQDAGFRKRNLDA